MATLQVTKQFNVTLDSGKAVSLDAGTTVENVGEVFSREAMKIPTSEVTVLLIGAAVAAGQLKDIKLLVIQNLDTVNYVTVSLKTTGGSTVYHVILPGKSLDIYDKRVDASESGAAFDAFTDIDTISAQANTADVSISILAAESC